MNTEIKESGRKTRKVIIIASVLQVVVIAIFSVYFLYSIRTSFTDSNEETRRVIENIREEFDNEQG